MRSDNVTTESSDNATAMTSDNATTDISGNATVDTSDSRNATAETDLKTEQLGRLTMQHG